VTLHYVTLTFYEIVAVLKNFSEVKFVKDLHVNIQSDSKLLSGFPWPIIFKPEKTDQNY
jgi:hypothetical protein